jgi:hypothetical protein
VKHDESFYSVFCCQKDWRIKIDIKERKAGSSSGIYSAASPLPSLITSNETPNPVYPACRRCPGDTNRTINTNMCFYLICQIRRSRLRSHHIPRNVRRNNHSVNHGRRNLRPRCFLWPLPLPQYPSPSFYLTKVHMNQIPSNGDCSAAGDHFDPYNVGDVVCDPNNPGSCQVTPWFMIGVDLGW